MLVPLRMSPAWSRAAKTRASSNLSVIRFLAATSFPPNFRSIPIGIHTATDTPGKAEAEGLFNRA
jgi:hypothetical protein